MKFIEEIHWMSKLEVHNNERTRFRTTDIQCSETNRRHSVFFNKERKERRGHLVFHCTTFFKRQKEDEWNETLCAKSLRLILFRRSQDLVNRLWSTVIYLRLRGNHCLPFEFNEFPPLSSKKHSALPQTSIID